MEPLTSLERLRLAWHLAWPGAVITLLEWGIGRVVDPAWVRWTELPWLLVSCFVIGPAIVRRAFSRDLGGCWLEIIRPEGSGEARRWLSYGESLAIYWWFTWRIAAVLLLVALAGFLAFLLDAPVVRHRGPEAVALTPLSLFVIWWLLPDLLRERFRPQRSALP